MSCKCFDMTFAHTHKEKNVKFFVKFNILVKLFVKFSLNEEPRNLGKLGQNPIFPKKVTYPKWVTQPTPF